MDFFKGAAAKGMQKLQGVGKNLTTKVTASKLNSAWQKAGAPTDSEALKTFLQSQGVDQTVVDTVYSSLKIKSQPVKSAAGATDKTKAAVSPTTDVPAGAEQSAATQTLYAQLKKDVMGLNKKEKQRIFAYLQKQLGTV
jgi:ribosomal protein L12E/L44/L45/RPP1/RPP2